MSKPVRTILGLIAAIVAAALGYGQLHNGATPVASSSPGLGSSAAIARKADNYADAADQILAAFESQRSNLWIEAGGTVQRELADDSEGARHQRFIVRLANDHTVLIAHNIDLAQRVPVKAGNSISFYGEYEWNDRGGVIHWTHHDPRNPDKGGWIHYNGTIYR